MNKILFCFFTISCISFTNAQKKTSQADYTIETSKSIKNHDEKYYLEAIRKDSTNVVANYNLGVFYADLYQFELAERQFLKVIQLDETFKPAYTALTGVYLTSGNVDKIASACETALLIDPLSAINHLNLGIFHFQNIRFEEAESSFLKGIELDSSISDLFVNLGVLLMQISREDEAKIHLQSALRLNPKELGALYSLASIYSQQEQLDEAYGYLESAIINGMKYYELFQLDTTLAALRTRKEQWKALMKKYFPEESKNLK